MRKKRKRHDCLPSPGRRDLLVSMQFPVGRGPVPRRALNVPSTVGRGPVPRRALGHACAHPLCRARAPALAPFGIRRSRTTVSSRSVGPEEIFYVNDRGGQAPALRGNGGGRALDPFGIRRSRTTVTGYVNDRGGQAPALRGKNVPFTVGLGPSDATRACERVSLATPRSGKRRWLACVFRAGRAIAGDRPPRYGLLLLNLENRVNPAHILLIFP